MIISIIQRINITFNNPLIWRRVVENHDPSGVPQPVIGYNPFQRGTGFQDRYNNGLRTQEDVAKYLGYVMAYIGLSLSQIEGWTDCKDSDIEVRVVSVATACERDDETVPT